MNVIATTHEAAVLLSEQRNKANKKKNNNDIDDVANIHFYDNIPQYELSIDEFEVYAIKRLKVLKKIEQLQQTTMTTSSSSTTIPSNRNEHIIEEYIKNNELDNTKIDIISHYILRLSYCRTEDLRHWLCKYECELLKFRLQYIIFNNNKKVSFDNNNHHNLKKLKEYIGFEPISNAMKEQYNDQLSALLPGTYSMTSSNFYMVPFTHVLKLISTRSCFVRNGYAFVHEKDTINIILQKFRTSLSKELAIMGRYQYQTTSSTSSSSGGNGDPEAVRILPLLHNIDKAIIQREPQYDDDHMNHNHLLTSSNMNQYIDHMPLCMRNIHRGMMNDGKLKYHSRLQYSLFLKGAGLTMDDCIMFLQRHFRIVSTEAFNKEYSYNIRHIYGKEGKRESKSSYSCLKIIMGLPAPSGQSQHHGCPYQAYDSNHLTQLLTQMKIGNNPLERKDLVNTAKELNSPQVACQKHFFIQHPEAKNNSNMNLDNVGNHPNAWFRASLEYQSQNNPQQPSPPSKHNNNQYQQQQPVAPMMTTPTTSSSVATINSTTTTSAATTTTATTIPATTPIIKHEDNSVSMATTNTTTPQTITSSSSSTVSP